jgi:hypothetical protein
MAKSPNDLHDEWLQEQTLAFPGITKFDASDALPDYIGMNTNPAASDDDTDWLIYKYTYSGTAATQIVRRVGSWTGRAALFS